MDDVQHYVVDVIEDGAQVWDSGVFTWVDAPADLYSETVGRVCTDQGREVQEGGPVREQTVRLICEGEILAESTIVAGVVLAEISRL